MTYGLKCFHFTKGKNSETPGFMGMGCFTGIVRDIIPTHHTSFSHHEALLIFHTRRKFYSPSSTQEGPTCFDTLILFRSQKFLLHRDSMQGNGFVCTKTRQGYRHRAHGFQHNYVGGISGKCPYIGDNISSGKETHAACGREGRLYMYSGNT